MGEVEKTEGGGPEQGNMDGIGFTLASSKKVVIRNMKIRHRGMAQKAALKRSGGDAGEAQAYAGEELFKLLLHSVDGKKLSGAEKEDLEGSGFTPADIHQVESVIGDMTGLLLGKPKVEIVSLS